MDDHLAFTCAFTSTALSTQPVTVAQTQEEAKTIGTRFGRKAQLLTFRHVQTHGPKNWNDVVLSQYLLAIQSAGTTPPQETGLTYNSWFGKFHLEMIWWHEAQFALWNRSNLLDRTLGWYERLNR